MRRAKNSPEIYRLVTVLELPPRQRSEGSGRRLELFRSTRHPRRFRFWLFAPQYFSISPAYWPEPLLHELLTTVASPNGGLGEYFVAPSLRLAEEHALRVVAELTEATPGRGANRQSIAALAAGRSGKSGTGRARASGRPSAIRPRTPKDNIRHR